MIGKIAELKSKSETSDKLRLQKATAKYKESIANFHIFITYYEFFTNSEKNANHRKNYLQNKIRMI